MSDELIVCAKLWQKLSLMIYFSSSSQYVWLASEHHGAGSLQLWLITLIFAKTGHHYGLKWYMMYVNTQRLDGMRYNFNFIRNMDLKEQREVSLNFYK